jgi:hypothetical protein
MTTNHFGEQAMRVVKMSKKIFPNEAAVETFFNDTLPNRNPPGLFHFHTEIRPDGLRPGERLLFTYRGRLRRAARAATGCLPNTDSLQDEYPNYFRVNPQSIQRANGSFARIEQAFAAVGVQLTMTGPAWVEVEDSQATEQAVATLLAP